MTEHVEHNDVLMPVVEREHQRRLARFRDGKELMHKRLSQIILVGHTPVARYFKDKNNISGVLWTMDHPFKMSANRIYHCLDGPAKVDAYGKEWFVAGFRHRIDGPALEDEITPRKIWYLYGMRVHTYTEFQEVTRNSDGDILILKLKWGKMK